MNIVRKQLAASQAVDTSMRWIEATDTVEYSPDGGFTWRPAIDLDPRSNGAYQLAPLTGSDPRCRAAEGARVLVQNIVNQRLQSATDVGIRSGLLGLLATIFPIPFIADLVINVAGILAGLDAQALTDAFDEDGYELVRCAFYNNMDSSGVLSVGAIDDVIADCADLGVIGQTVIIQVALLLGVVGLNNASVQFENSADCSGCDGWCYTFDFTQSQQSFTVFSTGSGSWSASGWGSVSGSFYGSLRTLVDIRRNMTGVTVNEISMVYDLTKAAGGSGQTSGAYIGDATGGIVSNTLSGETNGTNKVITWNGSRTINQYLRLQVQSAFLTTGGFALLKSVTLRGDGPNPFGSDNC